MPTPRPACLLALALTLAPLSAQCPAPTLGLARPSAPLGLTNHLEVYDAGSGPQLYVSGADLSSTHSQIWRWLGTRWELVLDGTPGAGSYDELQSALEGTTPVLLACLNSPAFTSTLLRYDGSSWTTYGGVPFLVDDVGIFDDGSGPALTVCGYNGPGQGFVARWNGTSFAALGPPFGTYAFALASFDDGGGTRLYVGGGITVGGPGYCARWNGTTWTNVGSVSRRVNALEVYDPGSGPALFAGLYDGQGLVPSLLQLSGGSWTPVGTLTGQVIDFDVLDLGSGPELAIAGRGPLSTSPALASLAFYDGASFTTATPVLSSNGTQDEIDSISLLPSGSGAEVFALGDFGSPFVTAGGLNANGLAAWNGSSWSVYGRGLYRTNSLLSEVLAFDQWDLGSGPRLMLAGSFDHAGGASPPAVGVTQWGTTGWTSLAGGLTGEVYTLGQADFGSGTQFFAGGKSLTSFAQRGVMRWNGSAWVTAGWGNWGDVHAFQAFDFGAGMRLVAGGNFNTTGGAPANFVMAYDGASWTALSTGMDDLVAALTVHDDGSGPQLYAGGRFTHASGPAAAAVAVWNGTAWMALGPGITGQVTSLASFDDGTGALLYAGGVFTTAGFGVPVQHLARWNGSLWSDVPGGGANGAVLALKVHDDGFGPALYVGGGFSTIGGISARNLARFDGTSWSTVVSTEGEGTDNAVTALASFDDDGDGDRELFVGGRFVEAFGVASSSIARLEGLPQYRSFCFGDGTLVDHTTPCPCANNGAPGHGCGHSFDAGGALLSASGTTLADDVQLASAFEPVASFTLFMQHDAPGDTVFHDGVLCAGGTLMRLRGRNAVGGQASFPNPLYDSSITLSQRGGVIPGTGTTRYYAAFYRNASTTFCPPATANVTNGMRVVW